MPRSFRPSLALLIPRLLSDPAGAPCLVGRQAGCRAVIEPGLSGALDRCRTCVPLRRSWRLAFPLGSRAVVIIGCRRDSSLSLAGGVVTLAGKTQSSPEERRVPHRSHGWSPPKWPSTARRGSCPRTSAGHRLPLPRRLRSTAASQGPGRSPRRRRPSRRPPAPHGRPGATAAPRWPRALPHPARSPAPAAGPRSPPRGPP